nr:ctl [Mamestra configurata nucleopolyhedrovirus A]
MVKNLRKRQVQTKRTTSPVQVRVAILSGADKNQKPQNRPRYNIRSCTCNCAQCRCTPSRHNWRLPK